MKKRAKARTLRRRGTGEQRKHDSWEGFRRVREAAIAADPRAFAEFMRDRKDVPPEARLDEEEWATLAALDEGIADAKAGRTVAAAKVRRFLRKRTPELGK